MSNEPVEAVKRRTITDTDPPSSNRSSSERRTTVSVGAGAGSGGGSRGGAGSEGGSGSGVTSSGGGSGGGGSGSLDETKLSGTSTAPQSVPGVLHRVEEVVQPVEEPAECVVENRSSSNHSAVASITTRDAVSVRGAELEDFVHRT